MTMLFQKPITSYIFALLALALGAAGAAHAQAARPEAALPVFKRDRVSTHYHLPDGSIRAAISVRPVNYLDTDGVWKPIDTSLQQSQGGGLENRTNGLTSEFPAMLSDGIRYGARGQPTVEMRPLDFYAANTAGAELWKRTPAAARAAATSSNVVIYADVFPHVADEYLVDTDTVKHSLVLSRDLLADLKGASTVGGRFVLSIPAGLYVASGDEGRTIHLKNAKGETIYRLGQVFAVDAAGETGPGHLSYIIRDGALHVAMATDTAWLAAENRQWPVRIDPTLTLQPDNNVGQDAHFREQAATSNYGQDTSIGSNYGNASGAMHICIRFDLTSITVGSIVNLARCELYHWGNGGLNDNVTWHQTTSTWLETTLTWNTRPTFTAAPAVTYVVPDNNLNVWRLINGLGPVTQTWVNTPATNFGWYLINQTKNWFNMYNWSSDYVQNILFRPIYFVDYVQGPTLTATPIAGSPQSVVATETGTGGNGISAGTFTITSNSLQGAAISDIRVSAQGTGNDATAYSSVAIFRDADNNQAFSAQIDTPIGSPVTAFPTNDGTIIFPVSGVEQLFNTNETRRYFIVVKLNGTPLAVNSQTFNYTVDLTPAAGTYKGPVNSTVMNGLVIVGPALTATSTAASPQAITTTETGGGNGVRVASFIVSSSILGPSTLNSVTITASGTGNDQTTYTEIALWEDTNTNNVFDFGTDALYGAPVANFPADNGARTFTASLPFTPSQSRRFFIVVKLNSGTAALNAQTFNFSVTGMTVDSLSGAEGLPSAVMTGIIIVGPQLTVVATAGATKNALTTDTGGGLGILGGFFNISCINFGATLNSITLTSSGTGNDLTAYSNVRLYRDVNNNSTFEPATDTQYGLEYTDFGGDNGSRTFSGAVPYLANDNFRFLIVVRFAGPTPAIHGLTFNYSVTGITVSTGVLASVSSPATTINGFTILGPVFVCTPTVGVAQPTLTSALGAGNNGINAATFTLANNNVGSNGSFSSISILHQGTGNGQTAYTSVQLFEDSNNSSAWEATDGQVGATATAFNASNLAVFTPTVTQGTFNAATAAVTKRYFIVVKLGGAPAAVAQTFNYQVSAIVMSTNSSTTTIPNATTMNGLVISAPTFNIVDGALPQVTAYRNSGGYVLQRFTVTYPAGPANSLNTITIGASGSGNDGTDLTSLQLYYDSNTNGNFDSATDTVAAVLPAFGADNGTAVFTLSGPPSTFAATNSKTYFVVAGFGGTAQNGATYTTRVAAAATGYAGSTFTPTLPMGSFSAGAIMVLPPFIFTDNSNPAVANAFLGDGGFTLQKFTVNYPTGPANTIASITLTGGGTGNDMTDFAAVHLYVDDPFGALPGDFDPADTLVNTQSGFATDNGPLSFNLTGPASQFVAAETKQFMVVVDFSQAGINDTTFFSQVTGINGTAFGAQAQGLPAGPSAGLHLLDANLWAFFNGPSFAISVNSNDQGVNGEGVLLCDVTLATGPGSEWQINSVRFVGTGTGDHATAYADLWLYEDDGNGQWDGPNLDSPAAAPIASFAAGTFEGQFNLLNVGTPVNTARRFFLRGRLAGTATTGQTLNARLDAVNGTPVIGGSVRGTPLVNSTATIVEATAVTIFSGPATAPDLLRKSGTSFVHPIMNLRLGASNNDVTVNGVVLSNSGDFSTTLSANGFQVWLDNGDGVFAASDSLLFQGAGSASVDATFSTPLVVPNSETRDLWVVLDVLASAGAGSPLPLNLQSVVNATTDVTVPGNVTVLLGTPAPQSNVLRLVDFYVTSFDPNADVPTGGRDITISGSGFMSPIIVSIDGVVCPGTPVITGGMQITGLTVPPGSGTDLEITIKSGQLPTETLTMTFDYVPLATTKVSSSDGCVAGTGAAAWWPALAAILPVVIRLRRRK